MGGWIKLYDKMLNWEWYGDTNVVRVFLHCLLAANYQESKWCGIVIERGQFITSIASMSKALGLTPMQVRVAIQKLQNTKNITSTTTNKYTIITVCKYSSYQGCDMEQQQAEQQTDNKRITNKQQTNNKQITTATEYTEYTDIQNNIITDKKEKENINILSKEKSEKFSIKKKLMEDGLEEDLVNAYMQVRKNKKAPDSLIAYKGLEREAIKAGISLEDAITECVERNWVGFKADWYCKAHNLPPITFLSESDFLRKKREQEEKEIAEFTQRMFEQNKKRINTSNNE